MPRAKRIIKLTTAAVAAILLSLAVYAFLVEPSRLVIKHETIELRDWPKEFEGLRIAVISDLHVGSPFITTKKLDYIAILLHTHQPDLIVFLGDFMSSVAGGSVITPETTAEHLKSFRARDGVFAVLGNHDWWYDGDRVFRALESAGIKVLEDDAIRLQRGESAIWVIGLKDAWTNETNIPGTLGKVTDNAPVIAITHNPDLFVRIPERVVLTLAGHTHGGQVNLPFFGRKWVPSEFGERYAAGHIIEQNHHLFVTTGVGTSVFPVRFRVPPEIVILTINSAPINE